MKVRLTFELSEGSTSNISKLPEMTTYQYIPLLPGRNTGRGWGRERGRRRERMEEMKQGKREREKVKEGRGEERTEEWD